MANQQLVKGAAAAAINFSTQGTAPGTTAPPASNFSLWQGNTQLAPNTPLVTSGSNHTGTTTDGSGLTVTVNGAGQPQYTVGSVSLASGSTLANATGLYLVINSPNNAPSYATVDIVAAAPSTAPQNLTSVVEY